MEDLCVYDKLSHSFVGSGLAILNEASNICIVNEVNGERSLSFLLPLNSPKWAYMESKNIVKADGQPYRIQSFEEKRDASGNLLSNVQCSHVWTDASTCKHIESIPDMLATTARDVLLIVFAGTPFHIMMDLDLPMGLEWNKTVFDFWSMSKTDPEAVTGKVIESINGGELYTDGYNIAIVKQLGKKSNVYLSMDKNLKSIRRLTNCEKLVTRLYPYGKDSLTIGNVNTGDTYIDSPNIDTYGLYCGYKDYSSIDDPAVLLALAQAEFSSGNPDRIDIPDVSYEGTYIDLSKLKQYGDFESIGIGDVVKVRDTLLGAETMQRIMRIEYFPNDPQATKLKLGRPPATFGQVIYKLMKGKGVI